MSNEITIPQGWAPSTRFQGRDITTEFSDGIETSFAMYGYRGKVWSVRYRGDNKSLMREDGDGPRGSIEVIFVQASRHKAKVWYENGYEEGSNAAPDCWSNNGVTPDPQATKKQCDTCALCRHNAFGTGPNGKGKACSDSKRVAVVPVGDIQNTLFGGPMLLRIPAASLNEFGMYADVMAKAGFPLYAIATRVSFDPDVAYPKFKFHGIRPLIDAEVDEIESLRDTPLVKRIHAEQHEGAAPAPAQLPPPAKLFEQPTPVVTPKVTPAPQPVAPTAQPMPTQPTAGGDVEVTSSVVKQPMPQPTVVMNATNGDFEKSLEDKLAKFLPAT